jgi:hypothetical protein
MMDFLIKFFVTSKYGDMSKYVVAAPTAKEAKEKFSKKFNMVASALTARRAPTSLVKDF